MNNRKRQINKVLYGRRPINGAKLTDRMLIQEHNDFLTMLRTHLDEFILAMMNEM